MIAIGLRGTLVIAATLAIINLAGCAGEASHDSSWSTKDQSVLLGAAPTEPQEQRLESPVKPRANLASRSELIDGARSLLREAAKSNNPVVRANALEALNRAPGNFDDVLRPALADENRGVRFVAAMSVGKLRLNNLALLVEPLLLDPSESVQAAAMYALRRCGRKVDLNPLGRMILSNDPEVRGNAAFVLGEIGDKSAVPLLISSSGHSMQMAEAARVRVVELQVAEALVKLGEVGYIGVIEATLFSPIDQAELTALAAQMCGTLRNHRAINDLSRLAYSTGTSLQPPEVRLAAVASIGKLDRSRADARVPMVHVSNPNPALRAQAASTLGSIRSPDALGVLQTMLNDPSSMVQVMAASAILEIYESPTAVSRAQ